MDSDYRKLIHLFMNKLTVIKFHSELVNSHYNDNSMAKVIEAVKACIVAKDKFNEEQTQLKLHR